MNLEEQAQLLANNVMGWENKTLERIGARIRKYGKLSLSDVKSINNIATVKQDMDAITKELAKVTGYNISQIEQMYGELLEEQHLANQLLYDYRGKTFVPFVILIMGSCVFRLIWIYTVFAAIHTIRSLYLLYPFSWIITGVAEYLYLKHIYRKIFST